MNHKPSRFAFALIFVALLFTAPRAQQTATTPAQSSDDRVALYQALLDLQNPWTVMCVAAHPDDEDGTSLIVMRRKYGAHTVSLFSTFGEGGQNAIGPELYEEMGAIRARETMAASEIQGSEPHFLGLQDFGFSKSRAEAFQKWGHEEALRRMVLQIRKLHPDVIITNHSVTSNDHGHHQATAVLVVEAFEAAADPKRFPEQLKNGLVTWQVQRLFVRARGIQTPAGDAGVVTINPNDVDPVRGVSYAEEALRALQQHATQGPWPKSLAEMSMRLPPNMRAAGRPLLRYTLAREANGAGPLPTDSHNFLDGLQLTAAEASEVSAPQIDGRPMTDFLDQPGRIIDALEVSWKGTQRFLGPNPKDSPQDKFRISYFVADTNRALAAAHGIKTSLLAPEVLTPGTSAAFKLVIANNGRDPITLSRKNLSTSGSNLIGLPCCPVLTSDAIVAPGKSIEISLDYSVPADASITVPHAAHLYDDRTFGTLVSTSLQAKASNWFWIGATKWVDVAPPVEIAAVNPSPLILRPDEVGVSSAGADIFPAKLPEVRVQLINYLDQRFNGEVLLGTRNQPEQTNRKIELLPHQIATLAFQMPRPDKSAAAHAKSAADVLTVSVRATNSRENISTREVPIVRANARVARNLRVGYIRGFDFSLPNALNALGVESKELSVDEVKTADLSKFTSVIVDNRVYESQPDLIAVNQKLLDYANAGGNLIVFYHKSDEWNPSEQKKRPQLAPYRLVLGGERITDENAPITFLEADHPLLNVPNKLNQDDFKDWIQERGLYYPREWDPQFHALLQSNDPGEAPLKGGLLVTDTGKGHYIYSSMVWYRQLRAGVPGAYRMLANMISYGR